jgi:nitroimidazol reductase NimA-like FMN-containing flavoprotein (pyridoxamine 5'-phosphate oxidase superfamily)
MLRADREISDPTYFKDAFAKGAVITLSFNDGEFPYAVPLCFVEYEGALYMHCALEGHKLNCLANDPHVHFSLYENLGVDKKLATMRYYSVSGTGLAKLVADAEEKRNALATLAAKYESECTLPVPDKMLAATGVIKVDILSLTGKSNAKDSPVPFLP